VLPEDLLIARTYQGRIKPVFVMLTPELTALADCMVSIYAKGIGKKSAHIASEVRELEDGPFDPRLVRGFQALLDRRSEFAMESPVSPQELRRAAFLESGGFASSTNGRNSIISTVAEKFGISSADVDRLFWADMDEEKILKGFIPIKPHDLLAKYNLSLAQTLLFRSTVMEFTVARNWKNIFRDIKKLGLMYSIHKEGNVGEYSVTVEGPTSLIKLTERYGINLAKLLPCIMQSDGWTVRVQILPRFRGNRRLLTFELSSTDKILLPSAQCDAPAYDSSLEESFGNRFNAMGSRWKLTREPEPIPTGANVMIPDFSFELGSQKVFLEVVGFWTPEYVERKIAKLKQVKDCDLLIAADVSLGISKKATLNVIEFEKEVPLKPILDHLAEKEKLLVSSEVESLSRRQITINSEIARLEEIARNMGVSVEALRTQLAMKPVKGYALLGDYLISTSKLQDLQKIVEEEKQLTKLIKKLEAEGISDPYPIIYHFGYSIKMNGLSIENAVIVKRGAQ
jgi:predicted nuclease of restriction endonuclease-like RecB superfamily